MIKIDYDFSEKFGSTTISNTLTTGSTGLTNNAGAVSETNKIYEDVTATICSADGANSITFTNCLFKNCDKIIEYVSSTCTISFVNCTFDGCNYVLDIDATGFTIGLTSSIIFNCVFLYTQSDITLTDCIYNSFEGLTGTLNNTDSFNQNPLFIETADRSNVLISKARGYQFNSPALEESQTGWTSDAGCWTESRDTTPYDSFTGNLYSYASNVFTRSSGTTDHALTGFDYIRISDDYYKIESFTTTTVTISDDDYDGDTSSIIITSAIDTEEFTIDSIPDNYFKSYALTGFKKSRNETGYFIQFWDSGNERKSINVNFRTNWLENDEMTSFIDMYETKDTLVRFYPDNDDLDRWVQGDFVRTENINVKKFNSMYYDEDNEKYEYAGYQDIKIPIIIRREAGTWQA